jgi:uncharacterized protein YjbI with pentapeptide repeats
MHELADRTEEEELKAARRAIAAEYEKAANEEAAKAADLSGAHLEQADLGEARLNYADLSGELLERANLMAADLEGAKPKRRGSRTARISKAPNLNAADRSARAH